MADLITSSRSLLTTGDIVAQVANFTGTKTIDKASVDLSVVSSVKRDFIVGRNGEASFRAANFQSSRDSWSFQPLEPGVNIIRNGDFESDDSSDWTLTSWEIGNGVLTKTGLIAVASQLIKDKIWYQFSQTVNTLSAGTIVNGIGSTVNAINVSTTGSITVNVLSDSDLDRDNDPQTGPSSSNAALTILNLGVGNTVVIEEVSMIPMGIPGADGRPINNDYAIQNSLQTVNYVTPQDAATNAPCITYSVFLDQGGVFDLWGLGYISGGNIYWSWDGDATNIRTVGLGTAAIWTKFGSINTEKGGLHTFTVYLGDASTVILEQWFFTRDVRFDERLPYLEENLADSEISLIPLSDAPFNTVLRLRGLDSNGGLSDLHRDSPTTVCSWLPSAFIPASGRFNYPIQNVSSGTGVDFTDGVSVEVFQIGGSSSNFVGWDFKFTNESIGNAWISSNFGFDFTQEI